MREQIDALPRRCYQRRPKSQHEPWVHENGYIFHRGNAHVQLSIQVYQMGSGFPQAIHQKSLMIGADRSPFTSKPAHISHHLPPLENGQQMNNSEVKFAAHTFVVKAGPDE
jgi:hypothetical protein